MIRRINMLGRTTALTIGLLLVVGACGDDGDDPTVAGGTATTATTATTAAPGPTTTTAAVTRDCMTIGFTPNSEDAASSVKATGLPCSEAEAFVRIAGARTSSGGPARLTVEGYECVRVRAVQDPLPQAFYECTNGPKKVTFVRS